MVVAVNGIDLHYELFGDGEPLLWLHGGMGAASDWKYLFDGAPDGYRVIAPDLRGHGASTDSSNAFSFRQCALDVLALLEHLRLPRVKAIGLSGGGIALLHMATIEPACLASMVIVSAPPYFPESARVLQRQWSPSMLSDAEMEAMRHRHVGGDRQLQQLFAMTRRFADTYDDVNFTPPLLSTIGAETLIVFGDRDPLYPLSMATALHEAIPRSYLWVVPNGGHGPIFGDAAPRFRDTALSFLRGDWTR